MAGLAQKIGSAVDSVISVFSPSAGIQRQVARHQFNKIRSNLYAAAKITKSTGPWAPVNSSVNLLVAASAPAVRARVRQLVRDFPYFARAVNSLVDYTVGEGIMFQSRIKDAQGKLDNRRIQQTEDVFSFWADQADYTGKLHFYEMMRLAKRQDAETGEYILVKRNDTRSRRYIPYCLQMVEADWLTSMGAVPGVKSNEIDQGVEFEKDTGRVVALHFSDPENFLKTERVTVENVIHGFESLRPGQRRGISPFAPGVLVADDLASLMDSEIDGAKMASKWLALVKSTNPLERQINGISTGDYGEKIEELENAIIEYLRPGEDVELTSNPRPGANFTPFVRLILCMFSVTTGIPYEILSGDYQGMNYSTGKMIRNDFKHVLRPLWMRHIRQFCMPVVLPFFESAVLSGKLSFPNFFTNPAPWVRSEWQPPGTESIDPQRESKANADDIALALKSPQEIIKARGRDPEAVVKEIAAFNQLCEDNGVSRQEISTALANNPAATEEQKSDVRNALYEIMDALDVITERL